jgi:hypothetical protein
VQEGNFIIKEIAISKTTAKFLAVNYTFIDSKFNSILSQNHTLTFNSLPSGSNPKKKKKEEFSLSPPTSNPTGGMAPHTRETQSYKCPASQAIISLHTYTPKPDLSFTIIKIDNKCYIHISLFSWYLLEYLKIKIVVELFKKGKEVVPECYVFWFGIPIPKPSNLHSYKMLLFVGDFSFKRGKVK